MKTTEIILLGGGYVSVWAYRSIIKRIKSLVTGGLVNITVISPDDAHVFHGWTCEALTGVIQFGTRLSPLKSLMPLAKHIRARAVGIDAERQLVTLSGSDVPSTIHYDHLLIGTGSTDFIQMEGQKEYGFTVKGLPQLKAAMQRIDLLLQQAINNPGDAREILQFVVAGGGFTGVEVAANLAEYIQNRLKSFKEISHIKPAITLVHGGKEILPQLAGSFDKLHNYALATLAGYDIKVQCNTRLSHIDAQGAWLENGSRINASMVISTVGQRRFNFTGTENMHRDSYGRLMLTTFLHVPGYRHIWGGGDACNVRHCKEQAPCPSNALWAIKHGEHAGKNIARSILGKSLKPFTYPGLGQSASLGMGKGITELYGMQFTGVIAWWMRWLFFHHFIPSHRNRVLSIADWCRYWLKGRRAWRIHENTSNILAGVVNTNVEVLDRKCATA